LDGTELGQFTLALAVVFGCACASTKVPAAGTFEPHVLFAAYERAIEEHLPFESPGVLSFRYSPGSGSEQRLEYAVSFIMEHKSSGQGNSEEAYELRTVVRAAQESILQQLDKLFAGERDLPIELAVRQVRTERYDLLERTCPAIGLAYDRFAAAAASGALKPLRDGEEFHHGASYRLEGLVVDGSFSMEAYRTNPLFAWASETYDALRACRTQ
jgi:hypothetical protein